MKLASAVIVKQEETQVTPQAKIGRSIKKSLPSEGVAKERKQSATTGGSAN